MKRVITMGLGAVRGGSRKFLSTQPPGVSSICPTKAKQLVPCSHSGPKAPGKPPNWPAVDKKCPVFCGHGEKQCPPLVPPVTKPPQPMGREVQQIPTTGLLAYRLVVFGAKVGIAAYCIKWTIDKKIWGNSSETRVLWEQWKEGLQSAVPVLHTLDSEPCGRMSASQVWNSAVILTFDKGHEAARSLRRFVADKEHAAYRLSEVSQSSETSAVATSTKSDWSQLLRQFFHHNKGASPPDSSASRDALKLTNSEPRDEEDQALVETMAPGECHLAVVITNPGNKCLHRDDGQPLPEEPLPTPPPPPEVEELERFEAALKQPRKDGEVRTFCCQVHQLPLDTSSDTQVKMEPCGKPDCPVCPALVVRVE